MSDITAAETHGELLAIRIILQQLLVEVLHMKDDPRVLLSRFLDFSLERAEKTDLDPMTQPEQDVARQFAAFRIEQMLTSIHLKE